MQLQDIRTEVRTRMGITSTDQSLTDATLNTLINSSLRRINVLFDWPWLEASGSVTVGAGASTIAARTDGIRKMRWVRTEDRELIYLNNRDLQDYYDTTGRPMYFTEDTGTFRTVPVTDKAYDLTYGYVLAIEPTLTDDTDEPLVLEYAIDLLVADACVLVARRIRDRELERVFYAELRAMTNRLKDEMIEVYEGMLPRRIGDSRGNL